MVRRAHCLDNGSNATSGIGEQIRSVVCVGDTIEKSTARLAFTLRDDGKPDSVWHRFDCETPSGVRFTIGIEEARGALGEAVLAFENETTAEAFARERAAARHRHPHRGGGRDGRARANAALSVTSS